MTIPLSTLPQEINVLSLKAARDKYRPQKCRHNHIELDDELAEAVCTDCGEKLNPIAVLIRFATEETRFERQKNEVKAMLKELDARIRCKCQHCGQMTRIRGVG